MTMTLTLANNAIRDRAAKLLRACPIGWRVTFAEPKRSDEQNRRMWAALGDIAHQVEWYGEKLCAEDWKNVLTASLRKAKVVPGLDAGTLVPLGLSTRKMSKRELSALQELIYAFGSERGVVWSDPIYQREAA